VVQSLLPCGVTFPCVYLGLSLSHRKISKNQAQLIVDKIANQLLGCIADLLNTTGQCIQVQHVFTGMLIYIVMAIDLPRQTLQDIDKSEGVFFGVIGKMLREAIARWLGDEFADPLN
jgi:hypothetical protein